MYVSLFLLFVNEIHVICYLYMNIYTKFLTFNFFFKLYFVRGDYKNVWIYSEMGLLTIYLNLVKF